jgi:hypothetical protein
LRTEKSVTLNGDCKRIKGARNSMASEKKKRRNKESDKKQKNSRKEAGEEGGGGCGEQMRQR